MAERKEISYLGKDFGQLKRNLIDFTKQYFPDTYTNFSPENPGSIFMEMAAYVGDVLSYYADSNLKESLIEYSSERANIYNLAHQLGYQVKTATPAYVDLDVYQLVPSIGSGNDVRPDFNYALNIKEGMQVSNDAGNITFRSIDVVDFSTSSSLNPTDVTIYQTDDITNQPIYYLLKKQVRAVSGTIKTATYDFSSPKAYDKIVLPDTNVIDIISVEETDGDNWYHVPYLAQDTIFDDLPNIPENDPELSQYRSTVTSLLKLKRTSKRFVTRTRQDNKTELQFGSGISTDNDEEIIPNPINVGNGLSVFQQTVDLNIDPSNFLYTRTYGLAPANTTLTVTYTTGNGIKDNVESKILNSIKSISYIDNINSTIGAGSLNSIKRTVSVSNPGPATGAKSLDNIQEIKNIATSFFSAQNRAVTDEDYVIRCYAMPSRFGSVAKAYIVPDDQISQQEQEQGSIANPLALNLYTLGYNANKQLIPLNPAIKENLKRYLNYYRMLTDAINIKDAFVINIGLDFSITTLPNFNSNEVLLKCIDRLKTYFEIDRWSINQTIIKSDVINVIANTKGVQNVVSITFQNYFDEDLGYSGNVYDLATATRNGIIYPSLDPSVFEVKFPNQDIKGRVVSY